MLCLGAWCLLEVVAVVLALGGLGCPPVCVLGSCSSRFCCSWQGVGEECPVLDHGRSWSWVVECFVGRLLVVNTKKSFIKQGLMNSNWMVKANLDNKSTKDLRVTVSRVRLYGLTKHSGLVKVLLKNKEVDAW
jgi:hypothetical protein